MLTTAVDALWNSTILPENNRTTSNDDLFTNHHDDNSTNALDDITYYGITSNAIVTGVSSIALTNGITSWIIITKWRSFKNYVFLNLIIAALLHNVADLLSSLYYTSTNLKAGRLFVFFYSSTLFSYNLWMLIVCLMFYSDIVKVYKASVSRRYLKSASLAWGIPIVASFGVAVLGHLFSKDEDLDIDFIFLILLMLSTVLFMFVNIVLYLKILCTLVRNPNVRRSGSFIWSKIQVSTLLFLMSGAASVIPLFLSVIDEVPDWTTIVINNITFLPVIGVCVYLFASKPNRVAWRQYRDKNIRDHANSRASVV